VYVCLCLRLRITNEGTFKRSLDLCMILRHFRNIFVTDFDDVSGSKDPSMSMLLI